MVDTIKTVSSGYKVTFIVVVVVVVSGDGGGGGVGSCKSGQPS